MDLSGITGAAHHCHGRGKAALSLKVTSPFVLRNVSEASKRLYFIRTLLTWPLLKSGFVYLVLGGAQCVCVRKSTMLYPLVWWAGTWPFDINQDGVFVELSSAATKHMGTWFMVCHHQVCVDLSLDMYEVHPIVMETV